MKDLILDKEIVSKKIERMAFEIYEQHLGEKEVIIAGVEDGGHRLAELLKSEVEKLSPLKVELLRITLDKKDIYRHEFFHIGKTEQSGLKVYIDEKHHATLKTTDQATRYIDFLEGKRNNY